MTNLPEPPPRSLELRIDREALAANWRALDRLSGKARAGAAAKANCYGLGVDMCVPVLRDAGARNFFVAHWSEVAGVVGHVPPEQVSVLHGANSTDEVAYARAVGAVPVVNSLHQARLWTEGGGGPCDLMVDTGINRLGVPVSALSEPAIAALDVRVLLTHLSSADEDDPANARQLAAFREARARLRHREASIANSAGIALGEGYHADLTRPGLALYGGIPRGELSGTIRQVAFPRAAIIQTRDIGAGDAVGYNREFVAKAPMRVATVSLGYADGFLRARGGSHLVSEGRELALLGKVSMDMVIADITAAPDLRAGEWLDIPFDLPEISAQSGLSQYELLTTIGTRFRR
ncbi:alanine racemase [Erythrobacter sp. LQ02-29]|uniref:alanine racemase n=1 Tax=Erythrobacter sp. LQ02-29 TaxID=2920384 RepID=UPI001F4F0389|nr:alanine racemase [Erythrobacter sp. LQ02-29]MCP9223234.1 alanine racemase [Erythrobacter sp. LQ02-29]